MIFPLKLVVNDNTKKFDMAYLLYWMVINDMSLNVCKPRGYVPKIIPSMLYLSVLFMKKNRHYKEDVCTCLFPDILLRPLDGEYDRAI